MLLRARLVTTLGLCLLGAVVGCSSETPTPPSDAGKDVEMTDVPVFLGPGSLTVTWTINGMPPTAESCAALSATTVEMSTPNFSADRPEFPCMQGRTEFATANAGQYGLSTVLKGPGGTIYNYELPVTVESGARATANIDFSPPGFARVRWTINGEAPSADLCTSVRGTVVGLTIGTRIMNVGANCSVGTFRSASLQPGTYPVRAQLIDNQRRDLINQQMGTVEVPPGQTGETSVDFTARVQMMP